MTRLADQWLDAEGALRDELRRIDALRPSCPIGCDNGIVKHGSNWSGDWDVCPENDGNCDGKVPIEKLVATWRAVWDETSWDDETRRLYHHDAAFHAAIHIFRAVTP